MCDLNDQEELKKYTRRDFGTWAASAGLLTALPSVANAVAVAEREVSITTPDGSCDAYFVAPTAGSAPGVLVWPDVFGLRPAFRQMGRRLAESGYSVLVVNPFYRQKKAPTAAQGGQTPIAEVMPLMQALTPAMHLSDGKTFVAWLDAQREVDKARKLGTTGYCMGGPIAVRTAVGTPGRVGAVGTFHGAAMVTAAPDSPHRLVAQTQARYLVAVAENDDAKDPQAKVALRTAFDSAKLAAEVEVYPAAHGWCPPDTQVYDAAQAERAWARLLATFGTALA
ncbi:MULTISPECIES: dienelactone hydrolase family protein [Variovorax]|uniref:dienelactone hydrolase family protein n=1 Tax=Variovorax TaxID=34072 RepID=UPI00086C7CFD|nr:MULTISPECIES: dienelactone hydrolase family protein [Variovorax]MBN8752908.1 dienelactone hydrolase family protein [Variovorax sp.]ODU16831.1 MAG: dienelactone hydrolase [Variovorax sp. SCN 67-85]ODV25725.1 MAG: dienelactone hydrolase [Variovorax sp. SCN 67-20]OJZ15298.1 MAG: dienelactone hydrolase [Variovorax sp. 67-131]UKI08044.1 dienelactone hydrolase family protein [Variovorax paradoxus]